MRKYLATILLILTLPIGELHTFWHNDRTVENWIINRPTPMLIQWNVKYLCDEIIPIFYFLAWYSYRPNRVNKATVSAFLLLAVLDLELYVNNFKTGRFGNVYLWFLAFWIAAMFWKGSANYIWDWIRSVSAIFRKSQGKKKNH